MQQSKLFQILPDYICTPDGMAIDREGNLVLSCPNFADDSLPGCVVKIDRQGNVRKWLADERYSPDGETLDNIPFSETRAYVEKVRKAQEMYRELYGLT